MILAVSAAISRTEKYWKSGQSTEQSEAKFVSFYIIDLGGRSHTTILRYHHATMNSGEVADNIILRTQLVRVTERLARQSPSEEALGLEAAWEDSDGDMVEDMKHSTPNDFGSPKEQLSDFADPVGINGSGGKKRLSRVKELWGVQNSYSYTSDECCTCLEAQRDAEDADINRDSEGDILK
jgi:hypothetical protein